MAERYGRKPKMFSKDWWAYFMHYYKGRTIVILIILVFIAVGVINKINAPKYDLTLTYAGYTDFPDTFVETTEKRLSKFCPDTNGDSENLLKFNIFTFLENPEVDPSYNMAILTKFNLTVGEDEAYVYIVEKEFIDEYFRAEENRVSFREIKDWCDFEIEKEKILEIDGKEIGINLEGYKNIEKAGLDLKDTYLLIRYAPRKDQKDQVKGYEDAIKFANTIIDNK